MGFILSKFRKKKSTYEVLEQLEAEIASISEFKASTVVWQKKVVGYLVTYSIVIYLLLAMLVYFKLFPAAVTRQEQLLLVVPFMVFPGLIWGLRKVLTWWYHRKVRRDDMKLEQLKEKKAKIIDEVMEKETYKVAKQILDKFASGHKQPVLRPAAPLAGAGRQVPAGGGHVDATQLRRRATPVPPPSSSLSTSLSTISSPAGRAGPPLGPLQGPSGSSAPPPLPPPARPPGAGGLSRSAPGPPLPRPVLPRERGYLDKFVEFLVADGPSNRFALICRQCQSHNGMALREEFEYVAYRCCYCYYWNPARKQRPVAPRLPEQSALSAASDSSSGSDVSAPASAVQSRRSSILEEDGDSIADPVADAVAHSVADPVADPVADAVTDAVAYPADDKSEVDSSDMEVINKEDVCEVGSEVRSNEIEEELIVKLNNETTADKLIGDISDDAIPNVEDVDANPNMEVDE